MVTRIEMSKSLTRTLKYNENKIKQKAAVCIHAGNFLQEHDMLTMAEKKERFQKLNELHISIQSNTLHVSINFSPEDKLTRKQYIAIAHEYMTRIGFGEQPYLVYEHFDSGHPHFHIISTRIKHDGSSIGIAFIAIVRSEPARIAIEQKFGLIKAQGRGQRNGPEMNPLYVQKLEYGKIETKKGITNVLDAVLNLYKYTSLIELNAILYQYNVWADPGKPGSRVYENRGLLYKVLDEKGKSKGIPIKASAIYSNPGLNFLEIKFAENKLSGIHDLDRMRTYIDLAFRSCPRNFGELCELLKSDQINLLPYMNKGGRIYGLTIIDHKTKSVATGSTLGKTYSATAILERMGLDAYLQPLDSPARNLSETIKPDAVYFEIDSPDESHSAPDISKALDILRRKADSQRVSVELRREQRQR